MQRMQKMLVFPIKHAENVQKALTIALFLIVLHVPIECFLTLRPGPKAVSTPSHQSGISQNVEIAENVCISNQKCRKRAKGRDCGTFCDFSAFIFGKTNIFCIFCIFRYPQARPQSGEHAEPSNRNLPKCRNCRKCLYFHP